MIEHVVDTGLRDLQCTLGADNVKKFALDPDRFQVI